MSEELKDDAPDIEVSEAEEPAAAAPAAEEAASEEPQEESEEASPPEAPGAAAPVTADVPSTQQNMAPMTLTPQQEAAQRTAEDVAFHQDLSYGRIHPKTYSDLYDSKSLPGKIGTLFGLVLAGAGSGLTHQPNALMDMMNKEIERDVEAQKANQQNKQNWYRIAMEHEKQLPENALARARAEHAGAEADKANFMNKQLGIENLGATTRAINSSSASLLQENQDMINKMPPGPKKDYLQQMQDNVALPAFLAKAEQRNLETAQQKAVIKATMPVAQGNPPPIKGVAQPGTRYDSYNQGEFARRTMLGRQLGPNAGMVKDAIPESEANKIASETVPLTANRATYADAVESFNHLANMSQAGESPAIAGGEKVLASIAKMIPFVGNSVSAEAHQGPISDKFTKERQTQMEGLVAKMARGNMSPDAARTAVESWMPSWLDSPEQRQYKFQQLKNHFTSMPEEGAPVTKQFGLYYSPPNYQFKEKPIKKSKSEVMGKIPAGAPASARGQE